jgi:hypothetical protein
MLKITVAVPTLVSTARGVLERGELDVKGYGMVWGWGM